MNLFRKLSRVEPLEGRLCLSANPQSLFDVVDNPNDVYRLEPKGFTELNGATYFSADTITHGRELWKTTGDAESTVLVKDIAPGEMSSNPLILPHFGTGLHFIAEDNVHGLALWISDGTSEGTHVVEPLPSGVDFANWSEFTAINGFLFYVVRSPTAEAYALWRTDGTSAGTSLLKSEIGVSRFLNTLTVHRDELYFYVGPFELWKIPLNSIQPTLLKTWTSGGNYTGFRRTQSVGELLYVTGDDYPYGNELWLTDGTAAGTKLVKNVRPGGVDSDIRYMTEVNGRLFFSAHDGTTGAELWASDGTPQGTFLVKDIRPGSIGSVPKSLTSVNGNLFFLANNGNNPNDELWISDGTAAGTRMVKDLPAVARTQLMHFGDRVYFNKYDNTGAFGDELWATDGTEQGTVLFYRNIFLDSDADLDVQKDGILYFAASERGYGAQLWRTDGTSDGTIKVRDFAHYNTDARASWLFWPPYAVPAPTLFMPFGNKTLIVARDAEHGVELWVTEGAEEEAVLLADIFPGVDGSFPSQLEYFQGLVVFTARTAIGSYSVWQTDGTPSGTRPMDVSLTTQWPPEIEVLDGDTLMIAAELPGNHHQLWKTNGTQTGTHMVFDSMGPYALTELAVLEGQLYFRIYNSIYLYNSVNHVVDRVLFSDSCFVPRFGTGLWCIDNRASYNNLIEWNHSLYVTASSSYRSGALFTSSGSNSLSPLASFTANESGYIRLSNVVSSGGKLFFIADNSNIQTLWVSDGTSAGTRAIRTLAPDNAIWAKGRFGIPNRKFFITAGDGVVFFNANDGVSGEELWRSDGTPEGTILIADVAEGSGGSNPQNLYYSNTKLYFTAATEAHGLQAYVMTVDVPPSSLSLASIPIEENQTNVLVGTLSSTDPNANDTVRYELVAGAGDKDNKSFVVRGNELLTTEGPNYESGAVKTVRIRATDGAGLWVERSFSVEVLDVNEAPTTLTADSSSVNEAAAIGAMVGRLKATDPDFNDAFSFSFVGGEGDSDNASFALDGAVLRTNAVFDYESRDVYSVRLRVTDTAGLFFETSVAIHINNVVVPGDINGDDRVDLHDFAILRSHFGKTNALFEEGDLTRDGKIDLADFAVLRRNFGRKL